MRQWSIERWLLIATAVMSAFGFTFGLGVNWAHITEQDAALKAFERTYLRADVYEADQRRISESLDRLSDELKMWRQAPPAPPARTTKPTPPQSSRMFDR